MPYTVQIDILDPTVLLDRVTPIDYTDPNVTVTQNDDRFIVSLGTGVGFGLFDPGELVGLPNVPYLMLALSITAPTMPFVGGADEIILLGPQAVGAADNTRKDIVLLGPGVAQGIYMGIEILPFNHAVAFDTTVADPGPYRIVMTFEPFRSTKQPNGEDLPSAWAAGVLAS